MEHILFKWGVYEIFHKFESLLCEHTESQIGIFFKWFSVVLFIFKKCRFISSSLSREFFEFQLISFCFFNSIQTDFALNRWIIHDMKHNKILHSKYTVFWPLLVLTTKFRMIPIFFSFFVCNFKYLERFHFFHIFLKRFRFLSKRDQFSKH